MQNCIQILLNRTTLLFSYLCYVIKITCACFCKSTIIICLTLNQKAGFHTEGGCPGISPPRSSFPPPPRISYHNVIMNQIENCTSINAYRLMRLFFCLNMSKISAKLTEFSSGPSIAIRMSLVKLESFNRFRSRVFIIFI